MCANTRIAPTPLQHVIVAALFVFVKFYEGSAKSTVMTFCRPSFLFLSFSFLFARSLNSLHTGLIPVSSSFSCCFVRATGRYMFLFSTYGVPLAAFPFLSDLLASHSSEHLSFVLLCFALFSFFVFFFLFVSFVFVIWFVL